MSDNFNLDDLDLDGLNLEPMDLSDLEAELASLELEDIDLSGTPGIFSGGTQHHEVKLESQMDRSMLHKVMIVDDDAGTLRNIKSLLDDTYNVCVATNGVKALDILDIEKPEVILLDYEMPRMNGPETMQKIHQKPNYKNIPIVFLTGVNDKAQIAAALALRPSGYLLKPVNKEKLLMTLLDIFNTK
ncbi:MAG: response regulator [Lachnospiraceae bacterium]|nr:response regulator [Lachnospiraceae bacterium]